MPRGTRPGTVPVCSAHCVQCKMHYQLLGKKRLATRRRFFISQESIYFRVHGGLVSSAPVKREQNEEFMNYDSSEAFIL